MGFRNPATSASAVTTAATGARVRVFESADGRGNPRGVVAFDDGVPGDLPAQVYANAYPAGGGGMTLDGGSYAGHPAPTLVLQNDQAFVSSALLTAAGGFLVNGQPWAQQRAWRFERSAHTSTTSDSFNSTSGVVGLIDRTITAAPAGDYAVAVTFMLNGSSVAIGFLGLQGGPPAAAVTLIGGGSPRCDLTAQVIPYTFAAQVSAWPGGDLRFLGNFQVASAGVTGTVQTVGSSISVAYLGPRT